MNTVIPQFISEWIEKVRTVYSLSSAMNYGGVEVSN